MKKYFCSKARYILFLFSFIFVPIYGQDVAVNISGSVGVAPSAAVTYKIYVTNNGTTTATNVNVQAPVVANFTAAAISCANGPGNGGSSTCPSSVTLAGLQGAGLVIPSLPSGSAVVLTVTGTASSTPGNIAYTATVTSGSSDPNPSNNTVTLTTQVISNSSCSQSTYILNLAQTASNNTVSINGGTMNLVYTLSSGTAIPGLGTSFTVPVTYSDLNNNYGVDNSWYSIVNETTGTGIGLNLGMATYNNNSASQIADPGSIHNGLPANNIKPSPGLFNPYGAGNLYVDRTFTDALHTGSLTPLGTFTLSFGNLTLPSNVRVVSESLILQGRGSTNGSEANNNYLASGYLAKPLIQNQVNLSTTGNSVAPDTEMEFGQIYTWRYTAFYTTGLPKQDYRRGVVFKNGSITFAYNCPCNAGTAQVPLTGNTLSN